jgi:hypothetical protein
LLHSLAPYNEIIGFISQGCVWESQGKRNWREIAEEPSKETDSAKTADLIRELNQALDERRNDFKESIPPRHDQPT